MFVFCPEIWMQRAGKTFLAGLNRIEMLDSKVYILWRI